MPNAIDKLYSPGPVHAVVFDLDGTLLDTLEDLADCCNRVLRQRGFAEHPLAAYRHFVGDGREKLIWRALPEAHRTAGVVTNAVEEFNHYYNLHWADKTRPYPGVIDLLTELRRRAIQCAVVSNKPHRFTEIAVSGLLAAFEFAAVLGARDGTPNKPHPALAFEAAKKMGVAPQRCLYVGDTDVDMYTASAAGMLPVGASWGFRGREELLRAGAAFLLSCPQDLLELL